MNLSVSAVIWMSFTTIYSQFVFFAVEVERYSCVDVLPEVLR